MPRPRSEFNAETIGSAFTVASALQAGTTRGVLRHTRFERTFHGLRSTTPPLAENASLERRALDAARRFSPELRETEALSHTTALLLLGCPIRCDPVLHVLELGSGNRRRRAGVCGHRTARLLPLWTGRGGLTIVSPEHALAQSAGILAFRELVVAIDHLVHVARTGNGARMLFLDELGDFCRGYEGRGARRLRAAHSFARCGAESRMETLSRLELARYGLDVRFELQVDVFDDDGVWIGRFDLVCREAKLIVEYDGEQHRTDRAQYLKDHHRLDRARAAGYRVIRLHREDVLSWPERFVRRVAEAASAPLRPVSAELARFFEEGR